MSLRTAYILIQVFIEKKNLKTHQLGGDLNDYFSLVKDMIKVLLIINFGDVI